MGLQDHPSFRRGKPRRRPGSAASPWRWRLFILLYTTTLIYGQQVMHGILEEKNTRVVEILVAGDAARSS